MFEWFKGLFGRDDKDEAVERTLEKLRHRLPTPVFWLFGKTQSGKTSVVKYLTGADSAEIGKGFQPCTRYSRRYDFPTAETPLATFLDTRGLDEPGYDPAEDLEAFDDQAHLVLVTAKLLDHALENVVTPLRRLRGSRPSRPVVLALTCLHEAYPQQQHPQPYPFTTDGDPLPTEPPMPEGLLRSLAEQRRRFEGLVDRTVLIDLTPADEGFTEPNYGGERLREVLLEMLPSALRQTILSLSEAAKELGDLHATRAVPHILGYSALAAAAGAIPIPMVDLVVLSGIQTRMVYRLAELYGQPLSGTRFLELASTLGLGLLARQAGRELLKVIPWIGSVAGAASAGASTYALGKAFCYYYRAVHQGHVPQPEDLKRYFNEELTQAEAMWKQRLSGK